MEETWAHRADLAETAINDRHAQAVWSIPRTNLAVVSWPPTSKEKLFVHWHYWWQAHYLDCLVDAALRNNTKVRRARIADTMRGIRLRNLSQLTKNRYYDDKAWLALAMGRAENLKKVKVHKRLGSLQRNIREGVDPTIGVLPWREGETFLNVPSNGPGAIMLARMGRINEARHIVDWIYDHLVDDDGFIMDGIRMRMDGPEIVKAIHPYCQGVVLGACLEIALALREKAGLTSLERIDTVQEAELAADMMHYITSIRGLVQAVATGMATPSGVINWKTGDGDGGLFKGILVRYLADVAVRLPGDSRPTGQPRSWRRAWWWLLRSRCGSIAWKLMVCRSSDPTGLPMPACRTTMDSGLIPSAKRSESSASLSAICRSNCPVGCSWRPARGSQSTNLKKDKNALQAYYFVVLPAYCMRLGTR